MADDGGVLERDAGLGSRTRWDSPERSAVEPAGESPRISAVVSVDWCTRASIEEAAPPRRDDSRRAEGPPSSSSRAAVLPGPPGWCAGVAESRRGSRPA